MIGDLRLNNINEIHDLTYCWICGNKDQLEEHHIIPRAYGGSDGPVVTLCAVCHSSIHKAAQRQPRATSSAYIAFIHDTMPQVNARFIYLATRIRDAKKLTENDDNKSIQFSDRFEGDIAKKLKALVKTRRFGSSQRSVIRNLINQEYNKIFK